MGNNQNQEYERLSEIELIQRIREGFIDPTMIPASVRRRCVYFLTMEMYPRTAIMSIFRCPDRMIRRDMEYIRRNMIIPLSDTEKQDMLKDYLFKHLILYTHISKQLQAKDVTPVDKAKIGFLLHAVLDKHIERLQSLGILPNHGKRGGVSPFVAKNREKPPKKQLTQIESEINAKLENLDGIQVEKIIKQYEQILDDTVKEDERRKKLEKAAEIKSA